jgi:hypothetical protein
VASRNLLAAGDWEECKEFAYMAEIYDLFGLTGKSLQAALIPAGPSKEARELERVVTEGVK